MKTIKSVEKAIIITNYIAQHNGQKNLTEISTAMAISPGTLHGFLATLEESGMIRKSETTGKYALGDLIFKYSLLADNTHSLSRICHHYLDALRDETKETVHLAIPEGQGNVLYIEKAESPYPLRLTSLVGTVQAAAESALGYVLYELPIRDKDEHLQMETRNQRLYCFKYEPDLEAYCLATSLCYAPQQHSRAGISIVIPKTRFLAQEKDFYLLPLEKTVQDLEQQFQRL